MSTNAFQSGNGQCYPAAQGGSIMSDIDKQFKKLISTTKKTITGTKRKVVGTKRKAVGTKRKATVAKKKPAKRKATATKHKATAAKRKPTKRKPTKQKPTKRKPTKQKPTKRKPTKQKPTKRKPTKRKPTKRKPTKQKPTKRKPTKRKPAKRKTSKGGATGRPIRYFNGGQDLGALGSKLETDVTQLGGNSSDFVSTLSSRGPVNYPSPMGSGLSGKQLFNTFNKTGLYMPTETMNCDSVLTDGILNTKLAGC